MDKLCDLAPVGTLVERRQYIYHIESDRITISFLMMVEQPQRVSLFPWKSS